MPKILRYLARACLIVNIIRRTRLPYRGGNRHPLISMAPLAHDNKGDMRRRLVGRRNPNFTESRPPDAGDAASAIEFGGLATYISGNIDIPAGAAAPFLRSPRWPAAKSRDQRQ